MQLTSTLLKTAIVLTVSLFSSVDCNVEEVRNSNKNYGNFKKSGERIHTNRVNNLSRNPNGNPKIYDRRELLKSMASSNYYTNNLVPAPQIKRVVSSESDVSTLAEREQERKSEQSYSTISMMTATLGPSAGATTYATTDISGPQYRSPTFYLKAMYNRQEVLDDLEKDYANEFLKKGLVLAQDFEGGDRWDERFMQTLKRFYASLMQQTQPFIPDFGSKWRASPGESVYRSARLYTRNKSVDCGNLSMKLKMTGVIYDGHRNRVIKLFDRDSRKNYAYKTYGNPDEFYVEQEKFLWLDHPYYVKAVCHRKDLESDKAGILFEYVEGTGSMEYARNASPEQLKTMSAQLFLAVEHLHWLGIVHADLKPENVLIKRDGTVQVIDLGFATHLPQSKRRRGTHTTMAPELQNLVPGRVHEAIDWWAYGSTIAMWYGLNYAYRNDDGKRFIPMNWQENQFIEGVVPWRFPQELRNILQIFFQPDPNTRRIHTKRLLKQIRNHPFFNGIDWSQLHGGILN